MNRISVSELDEICFWHQLGYDILTSVHNVNTTSTKTHSIKLNDFSGLVQRLYVYAVDNAERTTNNLYLKTSDQITKVTFDRSSYLPGTRSEPAKLGVSPPRNMAAALRIMSPSFGVSSSGHHPTLADCSRRCRAHPTRARRRGWQVDRPSPWRLVPRLHAASV